MVAKETEMTKGAVVLLSVVFGLPTIAAAQDKALIERGVKVYAEQKCGVCHSIDGKGNVKGPLDDVGMRLSADELREWTVHPPR